MSGVRPLWPVAGKASNRSYCFCAKARTGSIGQIIPKALKHDPMAVCIEMGGMFWIEARSRAPMENDRGRSAVSPDPDVQTVDNKRCHIGHKCQVNIWRQVSNWKSGADPRPDRVSGFAGQRRQSSTRPTARSGERARALRVLVSWSREPSAAIIEPLSQCSSALRNLNPLQNYPNTPWPDCVTN